METNVVTNVALTALWLAVGTYVSASARKRLESRARAREHIGLARRCRDSRTGPFERIGARIQTRLQVLTAVDGRWVGRVAVALVAIALVQPVFGLVGATALMVFAWRRRERARRERAEELRREIPEVVDLFRVACASGLTVPWAIRVVGRSGPGSVAAEFQAASRRIGSGQPVADALEGVVDRIGEVARPLVAVLLASVRYGAELGPALSTLAHTARIDQRRRAEERARRVPVRLLLPLVVCILPAFGLLTVVPLVAESINSIGGAGLDLESP